MKKTNKRPVKATGKKVTVIVASLLAIALVAFSCYWVVKNWNSVKAFFNGTQIYTAEDVNTAYQDGYTNALADAAEYESLIAEYREEIGNHLDEIAEKQTTITNSAATIADLNALIIQMGNESSAEILRLQDEIAALNSTIQNLNDEIEFLYNQVSTFQTILKQYYTLKISVDYSLDFSVNTLPVVIEDFEVIRELHYSVKGFVDNQEVVVFSGTSLGQYNILSENSGEHVFHLEIYDVNGNLFMRSNKITVDTSSFLPAVQNFNQNAGVFSWDAIPNVNTFIVKIYRAVGILGGTPYESREIIIQNTTNVNLVDELISFKNEFWTGVYAEKIMINIKALNGPYSLGSLYGPPLTVDFSRFPN